MEKESLSLNHLRAKFADNLKILNYAKKTIKGYLAGVDKFYNYLGINQIIWVEDVTKVLLQEYQIFLGQEKNAKGRINSIGHQNICMKGVIYLFRFLFENDLISFDPSKIIKYARVPKKLPRNILSESEARKILDQPDINIPRGFRDRAILELFYSSGIRISELRNIDLSDVDFHSGSLIIRCGKGGKDRYVPIGKVSCQFLENYVHHVRQFFIKETCPTNALFVSRMGNRLSNSAIDELVRRYARLAGIKKTISCHSWRHTCATHLINRGMDVRHVQALLGHESLNSTQIYTRVAIRDLKRVIKKFHPREKEQN